MSLVPNTSEKRTSVEQAGRERQRRRDEERPAASQLSPFPRIRAGFPGTSSSSASSSPTTAPPSHIELTASNVEKLVQCLQDLIAGEHVDEEGLNFKTYVRHVETKKVPTVLAYTINKIFSELLFQRLIVEDNPIPAPVQDSIKQALDQLSKL